MSGYHSGKDFALLMLMLVITTMMLILMLMISDYLGWELGGGAVD